MSYYTVDYVDLSPYGDYHPPSLNDGIMHVGCFEVADCQRYVQAALAAEASSSGVHDLGTGEKIDNYHRSSSWCNMPPEIYSEVANRIEFVTNYHVEPQIMRKLKPAEPVQFLKYDASNSGHFNRHTDDAYWADGKFQRVAPYRKFTTITYLNDDYEGGEIVLDTVKDPQGRIICMRPPTGTTLIFPADIRFPHEVKPVTKGVRFSVVVWFDFA